MESITWSRVTFGNQMTKTAIVTGACGFIGSNLVDDLLTHDYRVIGIDNLRTGTEDNVQSAMQNTRFQLIIEDILSEDLIERVDEEVDTIFHLAAISSVKKSIEDPIQVNDVNVRGTVRVLELARHLDVKRIVFSSSAAVYGDPKEMPVSEETPFNPLSPYAASKVAGEMYLHSYQESYGIDTTILRYFNVYGPRQAYSEYSGVISIFINQALANTPITIEGDGLQTRSFIHVRDVVRATRLGGELKDARGATMNISGLNQISILDLATHIRQSVDGCSSPITHGEPRLGDVQDSIGRVERAGKILKFTPEIPLDQGLAETAAWYRDHQSR